MEIMCNYEVANYRGWTFSGLRITEKTTLKRSAGHRRHAVSYHSPTCAITNVIKTEKKSRKERNKLYRFRVKFSFLWQFSWIFSSWKKKPAPGMNRCFSFFLSSPRPEGSVAWLEYEARVQNEQKNYPQTCFKDAFASINECCLSGISFPRDRLEKPRKISWNRSSFSLSRVCYMLTKVALHYVSKTIGVG